ncbi:MAG: hypothetical protein GXY83_34265 [Rhodopirellula sp.]|nr:hypothetical protein [Rhodopirellula sp.]
MNDTLKLWYRESTGYHWWIFTVATLGWMFDTMDQRTFVLSRSRALQELLGPTASAAEANQWGGLPCRFC